VGVWLWSVLLWYLSAGFYQASAATAQNYTIEEIPSVNSKALTPDTVSGTAVNGGIIVDSPFDTTFDQHFPIMTSDAWPNVTSSGRRLRQTDQMFQQSYWFVGCHARVPNAAAARLKHLINQIRLNLKIVIREAQKGVDSPFGFRAFFKTNDNIPRVIEMFQNIANGDKIKHLKASQRMSWLMSGRERPVIGCAFTAKDKANDNAYKGCQHPRRYAFQPLGSAWVYLCPSFWNVQEAPSILQCPEMHDNGSLANPDDLELHMSQQAIFVHELVHVYLGLTFQPEHIEQYNLGAVIGLSGEEAVENASNYGW
jgi:hypothetical protein